MSTNALIDYALHELKCFYREINGLKVHLIVIQCQAKIAKKPYSVNHLNFIVSCDIRTFLHYIGKTYTNLNHKLRITNNLPQFSMCLFFLPFCENELFYRPHNICNKKWIHYNIRKCRKYWLSTFPSLSEKSYLKSTGDKTQYSPTKSIVCVWWPTSGNVHFEFLPSGKTVTSKFF